MFFLKVIWWIPSNWLVSMSSLACHLLTILPYGSGENNYIDFAAQVASSAKLKKKNLHHSNMEKTCCHYHIALQSKLV